MPFVLERIFFKEIVFKTKLYPDLASMNISFPAISDPPVKFPINSVNNISILVLSVLLPLIGEIKGAKGGIETTVLVVFSRE